MTRHRYNWPLIFAVLIDVMMLALLSRNMLAAGIGLALCLISFVGPKFRIDVIGQGIFSLFAAVFSYLIVMLPAEHDIVFQEGSIGAYGTLFAFAFLLVSVIRFFQYAPYGGDAVSAGLVFLSVLSMGSVAKGAVFPIGATAMLVLLTLACRYRDPVRPSVTDMGRRNIRALVIIFSLFGMVFTGLIIGLPLAYRQAFAVFEASYSSDRSGFSFVMGLGELDGLLQSDTPVMRLYGPKTDHLRGMVYTRYVRGRWLGPRRGGEVAPRLTNRRIAASSKVTIRLVGKERDRYFLPINASDVWLPPHERVVDSSGVLMVQSGRAETIEFTLGREAKRDQAAPRSEHLAVPEALRSPLLSVLESWGIDADGQVDREAGLSRIVRGLLRLEYSLSFEMPTGMDPVIAFLTVTKRGHCEYFASAAALLARTVGIPARVVGGYRVHEKNPIGDFYVVRERNAHAWVEVFVDGGWRTVDPTPGGEVFGAQPAETPVLAALLDAVAAAVGQGMSRVSGMRPAELGGAVASLLLVWGGVRLLRRYRERSRPVKRAIRGYGDPLPAFTGFLSRLERFGVAIEENETIDGFAKRIELLEKPGFDQKEVVALLLKYVSWRFGNARNGTELIGDLERWGTQKIK